MKKAISLLLALLMILGMSACSSKEPSSDPAVETKSEAVENPPMTEAEPAKEETVSEPAGKETPPEPAQRKNPEDLQAGIPPEYRLKINVPSDWNDPLPESEYAADSHLFGLGSSVVSQNPGSAEQIALPASKELFTIEELEAHFGETVAENQDASSYGLGDSVDYDLFETPESRDRNGYATINLHDYGSAAAVAGMFGFEYSSEQRKIDDLGKQALMFRSSVLIQVSDTAILTVSAWIAGEEEEMALDFARFVYDRLMEKMQ